MVEVGAGSMWCLMRLGTVFGDTFSMIVKDGRRSMVVGSEGDWCSWGRGMLEADSISFYSSLLVSHHILRYQTGMYLLHCSVRLHNP